MATRCQFENSNDVGVFSKLVGARLGFGAPA
jgi:hypothetical protein